MVDILAGPEFPVNHCLMDKSDPMTLTEHL
jgi:hypothetical protein